jgi:hypothetical protein
MDTLIVGKPTKGWEHARRVDKPYVAMKNLTAFGRYIEKIRKEKERQKQVGVTNAPSI